MAIGVRTRPEVIVAGNVQRSIERRKKDDGSLYAHDLVIETNGGGVYLRFWNRDDQHRPSVGDFVALVASIEEGQSASLSFVRLIEPNDLDLIVSASGLAATK